MDAGNGGFDAHDVRRNNVSGARGLTRSRTGEPGLRGANSQGSGTQMLGGSRPGNVDVIEVNGRSSPYQVSHGADGFRIASAPEAGTRVMRLAGPGLIGFASRRARAIATP